MASKIQNIAPEQSLGNFVLGEFFGDVECRHGHQTRLFNIGRGHYVGSNLISCWRQETKDIWQANYDAVKDYEFIE
jgi:hypothetical protein